MLSHINKYDQSKSQNALEKNTLVYEKIQQAVNFGFYKNKYPSDALNKNIYLF